MTNANFTTTCTVDRTPEEAFAAINNVMDGGRATSTAAPTSSVMRLRP